MVRERLLELPIIYTLILAMTLFWTHVVPGDDALTVGSAFGARTIFMLRRQVAEARQLGQYHLRRKIGCGGMGEVYLAEHRLLKRPCAIKLIRAGNAADPRALERFEREIAL